MLDNNYIIWYTVSVTLKEDKVMNKNVIADNEDVLIVEDFLGWLVVNKNTGGWSVLFAEEGIDAWFDVVGAFSKETSEKIIKSNILNS